MGAVAQPATKMPAMPNITARRKLHMDSPSSQANPANLPRTCIQYRPGARLNRIIFIFLYNIIFDRQLVNKDKTIAPAGVRLLGAAADLPILARMQQKKGAAAFQRQPHTLSIKLTLGYPSDPIRRTDTGQTVRCWSDPGIPSATRRWRSDCNYRHRRTGSIATASASSTR